MSSEKVRSLRLDPAGHKFLNYTGGQVRGLKDGKWSVLATPGVLEEPEYRYFIDADGDLARKPSGAPWSLPAVVVKKLEQRPLAQLGHEPALASIRFARMPFDPVIYFESELLEPDQALAAWQAARANFDKTGLAPVIRTFRIADHTLDSTRQQLSEGEKDRATSINIDGFFKAREAALLANEGGQEELTRQRATLDELKLKPAQAPAFHYQTLGKYVVLVLVRCEPWELAVSLGFGGWNDVPDPPEQSAVMRRWSELYGAELVVLGGDFVEMQTTRTLTPAQLKCVAWEHFLFADDVVFQGTKTVSTLAQEIATGRWFFWWD